MKKLLIITLLLLSTFIILSCGGRSTETNKLKTGDSIFVDKYLNPKIFARVHQTSSSGFVDGRAQVDSNKIVSVYQSDINREFFFEREKTFIGTYIEKYDEKYLKLNLAPDIKKIILKEEQYFGEKIKKSAKDLYSGKIRQNELLENFPDEIYIGNDGISNISADSVFKILNQTN